MSETTRVLQLITELRPGGAERIVYELARGLPRDRFAIEVCSLRPASGSVAGWLREAGVPVHSLEMTRKLDVGSIGRLRELLKRGAFSILHTHLFHANMIGRLAARNGVPPIVVGTIHIAERRFRPWHFWLDRMTLGPRGVEVCVSKAVSDYTRERAGIAPEQLRVIPNGVDLSRFGKYASAEARQTAARELRNEFSLSPETRVVVAVGRLEEQKGYPDLLEAWAQLRDDARPEVAGAVLIIGGEGKQRPALEAQIRQLGLSERVHLPGHREDIPKFLAGADLLAFSSHYEGFGLALVEAMAAGLPVVATAVDSVPEVLGDCSATRLVPARDSHALAKAIAEFLREMQGTGCDQKSADSGMGRAPSQWHHAARVRAQAFALPKMLDAYAALYDELQTKV